MEVIFFTFNFSFVSPPRPPPTFPFSDVITFCLLLSSGPFQNLISHWVLKQCAKQQQEVTNQAPNFNYPYQLQCTHDKDGTYQAECLCSNSPHSASNCFHLLLHILSRIYCTYIVMLILSASTLSLYIASMTLCCKHLTE